MSIWNILVSAARLLCPACVNDDSEDYNQGLGNSDVDATEYSGVDAANNDFIKGDLQDVHTDYSPTSY